MLMFIEHQFCARNTSALKEILLSHSTEEETETGTQEVRKVLPWSPGERSKAGGKGNHV